MENLINNNRLLMNIGVWCSAIGIALSPKMGFINETGSLNFLSIVLLITGLLLSTFANISRLRERRALTPFILISQIVTLLFGGAFIITFFIYQTLNLWFMGGIAVGVVLLLVGRSLQAKESQ